MKTIWLKLTLVLLEANSANAKWCKNAKTTDRNSGIWVLIYEYSVRPFEWIQPCILVLWMEVAFNSETVNPISKISTITYLYMFLKI